MNVLLLILASLVLTGCLGHTKGGLEADTLYIDDTRYRTVGQTNWLRGSITTMTIADCVPSEGDMDITIERHMGEMTKHTCRGKWVERKGLIYNNQPGVATTLFPPVIQGGAFVGGMYLLGDGIRDSGDQTTINQQGGDASSSSRSSVTPYRKRR